MRKDDIARALDRAVREDRRRRRRETADAVGDALSALADVLAELDATRDELREAYERISRQEASIAELRDELDGARAAVAQRWALRREVEAILGVPEGAASDEQLRLGVEAARRLVERAEVAEEGVARLAELLRKRITECEQLRAEREEMLVAASEAVGDDRGMESDTPAEAIRRVVELAAALAELDKIGGGS